MEEFKLLQAEVGAPGRQGPLHRGERAPPAPASREVRDMLEDGRLRKATRGAARPDDHAQISRAGAGCVAARLVGARPRGQGAGRHATRRGSATAPPAQQRGLGGASPGGGCAPEAPADRRPGHRAAAGPRSHRVSYYSNDDLARLLELILGEPFEG